MSRNYSAMKAILSVLMLLLLSSLTWAQEGGEAGFSPIFGLNFKAELSAACHMPDVLEMPYRPPLYLSGQKGEKACDYRLASRTCLAGDVIGDKLRIYTFPLLAIPVEGDTNVVVDTIDFAFADQTNFEKRKLHDFDCEAMFATEAYLYLLSKGWETGTTRLYRLPKTPGKHKAEVVNGFDSRGLVTGADYDRKNKVLVIVGYEKPIWRPFIYIIFDFDEAGVKLSHRRFEMPQLVTCQAEGICFFDEGKCFISAETTRSMTARVFEVDFRKWMEKNRKKSRK